MTAILTTCLDSTRTQPARIKASAPHKNPKIKQEITLPLYKLRQLCELAQWPVNPANVHRMAARQLCWEYRWEGEETLLGANFSDGYVWIFPDHSPCIMADIPPIGENSEK